MTTEDAQGKFHDDAGKYAEKAGARPEGGLLGRARTAFEEGRMSRRGVERFLQTRDGAVLRDLLDEVMPILELESAFRGEQIDRDDLYRIALGYVLQLDHDEFGGRLAEEWHEAVLARDNGSETGLGRSEPRRLTMRETTSMIRSDLGARWPGVKFSVRQSRGTAASWVDVSYVDGPLEADVRRVLDTYEGRRFNGQTDGYDEQPSTLMSIGGAEPEEVAFPTDGILCQRRFSEAALVDASDRFADAGYPELRILAADGTLDRNALIPEDVRARWDGLFMLDGISAWGPQNEYARTVGGVAEHYLRQVDLSAA